MAVDANLQVPKRAAPDSPSAATVESPTASRKTRRIELARSSIFVPTPKPLYDAVKVAVDLGLAAVLIVLAAPVMLLTALAVKLTSRGPVLYSQTRVGKNGRPFTLYKIRTMIHECEKASGVRWSMPGDPRITPIGAFLRKTHLDELPQLWNVLRGDMSLVGPRPERPEFTPALERAIPHYRDRLGVRPGVTGLAQVQLPPDTDLASVRKKLAYDLYYIRYRSLWLDLRLIACTAVHMAGVPYRALCLLFVMPRTETVETSYQEHRKPQPQFEG
jgi:lipopolysaccharide/colanic/teichoic acid biosynthesis glycosyltransferase